MKRQGGGEGESSFVCGEARARGTREEGNRPELWTLILH
jgi:hypothetical protein